MATYNGELYIKEQVDSILEQLGPDDELIVSDDGSKDKTLEILFAYNDSRITVLKHKKNVSKKRVGDLVSSNFENALKHVKGDYIFLSDQDDIWIRGKVEKMVTALQSVSVVCSNAWILNTPIKQDCNKRLYESRNPLRNYFLKRGKYYGCCMAFRKECLKYLLPFPEPMPLHDTWVGLLPEIVDGAIFIDEPLIYYRRHGNNTSGDKSPYGLLYKIWYRINVLGHIYYRAVRYKIFQH